MKSIHIPLSALILMLGACGGGGGGGGGSGGGLNSTPFPTPTPTPPPPPLPPLNAKLFANPIDGPVVVLAVGQVRDTGNATFVPFAIDASGGFDLRYIAAENRYEISGNGVTPSTLIRYDPPVFDASDPYRSVKIADNCCGDGFAGFVSTSLSANSDYKNAAIFNYEIIDPGSLGDRTIKGVAGIGVATPATNIPTTGTATFNGYVQGIAMLPTAANDSMGIPLFGGVGMTMDFAAGTVGGSISLADATDPAWGINLGSFGSFMLTPTSLSSSGAFNTGFVSSLSGINLFQGQLAGPTAGEAFGRFAVPFQFDGATYQAGGAWVAKR